MTGGWQGVTGDRKSIPRPTEAALWALSNRRCYFPRCPAPVVVEVRAGVYRKNVQVAHIFGVRPDGPRFRKGMSEGERDSFLNLLLMCLPHHADVDAKKEAEIIYPPELLRNWKTDHEGSNGPALAALGPIDEEDLMSNLARAFSPPIDRLRAIAEQLHSTGALNVPPECG